MSTQHTTTSGSVNVNLRFKLQWVERKEWMCFHCVISIVSTDSVLEIVSA
jgi:hypothetical protein